jgi:nucleotide-binding universal stress UspA family protein
MIAIKDVLVPIDFSPGSDTALTYGREFARTFGATLHTLHAVEDVYVQLMMAGGAIGGTAAAEIQRDLENAAQGRLDALIRDDDRRELRAQTAIRTGVAAAQAIVDYAQEKAIDLVVIGTHGRGGMAHVMMGSVAEKVVRTAPCPVLAVRSPEHDFVRPDASQRVASTES